MEGGGGGEGNTPSVLTTYHVHNMFKLYDMKNPRSFDLYVALCARVKFLVCGEGEIAS